ncbi:exosortase A [Vibrio sp. HN007]|uniref:exosortase A n=1 Tax=Vibrio iocasae TaxID=3098914 RepID=UPI0035D4D177
MIKASLLRFGLPILTWTYVFFESITGMVAVWGQSKTYEHSFLIVPICLWLVWQEKHRFNLRNLSISWPPLFLLTFPCLLWIIGRVADIALFEHVAAVTSLQLILWAMLGNKVAKSFYFPIIYLFFCIPFGEELVPYLQSITADISVALVRFSGIPIYREGMYLTIPNGLFEVAEACSGIRFLISSIALGTLFAYMFFSAPWKMALFIAFSCILPIIANGFRAYGIIVIGYYSDMKYATGADHLIYGWFFFSFITIISFSIAYFFKEKHLHTNTDAKLPGFVIEPSNNAIIASLFTLALLIGVKVWSDSIITTEQTVNHTLDFPEQTIPGKSSEWGVSFPHAKIKQKRVTSDGKTELFAARYSLNQKKGELISYINRLYDKNMWTLDGRKSIQITTPHNRSFDATYLNVTNSRGEKLAILYWYCINEYCSTDKLKLKLERASTLISGTAGYADVRAIASRDSSEIDLARVASEWISADRIRK